MFLGEVRNFESWEILFEYDYLWIYFDAPRDLELKCIIMSKPTGKLS